MAPNPRARPADVSGVPGVARGRFVGISRAVGFDGFLGWRRIGWGFPPINGGEK